MEYSDNENIDYIANADDEEPDCNRCDHICSGYWCEKCGPEYWWNEYRRTVYTDEFSEKLQEEQKRHNYKYE